MGDLTLCRSRHCSRRSTCYRYRAEPVPRQSFARFDPATCDRDTPTGEVRAVLRPTSEVDAEIDGEAPDAH